jgi:hypothetical protein
LLNVEHVCSFRKLDENGYISWAWENMGENIKISAKGSLGDCEQAQCKLWLNDIHNV